MRPVLALALALSLPAQGPDPGKDPLEPMLRAHMAFLADGLLEGRGTGHRGGALAVRYLETQLQALGLQPLPNGTYRQAVPVAGIRIQPGSRLAFGDWVPDRGREVAYHLSGAAPSFSFGGGVVFVGHGITARDGSRDDYRGVDVKGRLVLMLVGDRPDTQGRSLGCAPENYYGRWAYKFEEAARRGAAAALLVHTEATASYPWSVVQAGWLGERFAPGGAVAAKPQLIGWIHQDAAARLAQRAGRRLEDLVAAADRADFRPQVLNLQASARVQARIRTFTEYNVAGVLPGTDPALAGEAVIASAHWDHLGPAEGGDCFHGAVDNASACAGALALAAEAVRRPLPRSQVFLFPCLEEQGMLGSRTWVQEAPWPLDKTVAVVNLESLNVIGPTRDIGLRGAREAGLWEASVAAARAVGLVPAPERPDAAGLYFRADHWPFAQAGVPAFSPGFSLDGGWDFLGDREAQQARAAAYNRDHYHRTSDRYDPAWDLWGMVQQVRFCQALMQALAAGGARPAAQRW